jgi:hypothetical protein
VAGKCAASRNDNALPGNNEKENYAELTADRKCVTTPAHIFQVFPIQESVEEVSHDDPRSHKLRQQVERARRGLCFKMPAF